MPARRLLPFLPSCLAACLAACPAGPAAADVTVAVVGPMTGQFAAFGAQMKAGAEKAVADINAAGGIAGERLVLEAADDRCDAAEAEAVANQLAGKGAALVVGHVCFGAAIPAAEVYAAHGVVMITPAVTLPRLTDDRAGPTIFRLAARDDRQAAAIADYLAANLAGGVAVVDDRSPYGRVLAEEVTAALAGAGVRPVLADTVAPGGQDYSGIAARLAETRAAAVFFGGYYSEAALILQALRQADSNAVLIGGDALIVEGFWESAGPAGEGTLVTFPPDPADSLAAAPVAEALRADGIVPEGYTIPAYAAVELWAKAAGAAASFDGPAVAAVLASGSFHTVLGPVSFDARGDARLPGYVIYSWHGGAPVPLQP